MWIWGERPVKIPVETKLVPNPNVIKKTLDLTLEVNIDCEPALDLEKLARAIKLALELPQGVKINAVNLTKIDIR